MLGPTKFKVSFTYFGDKTFGPVPELSRWFTDRQIVPRVGDAFEVSGLRIVDQSDVIDAFFVLSAACEITRVSYMTHRNEVEVAFNVTSGGERRAL